MTQNAKKKRGDVLPHKRRAIRARAAREGTDDL